MGVYPAQAIINIQVYQSELFREPPLRPSHRLHQLSFPCEFIIAQDCSVVKCYFEKMGYCIAHNPLLFQPLRHWLTFIYRKCEHLAVGSSGRGLTRSRGRLTLPCCVLIISQTLRFVKTFFNFFFGRRWELNPLSPKGERFQGCDPVVSQPFL